MAQVNDPKSSWQELYQAALVESDKKKLNELILAVEEAMFLRAQGLSGTRADDNERSAMASHQLLIIKTKSLGWPDVSPK